MIKELAFRQKEVYASLDMKRLYAIRKPAFVVVDGDSEFMMLSLFKFTREKRDKEIAPAFKKAPIGAI